MFKVTHNVRIVNVSDTAKLMEKKKPLQSNTDYITLKLSQDDILEINKLIKKELNIESRTSKTEKLKNLAKNIEKQAKEFLV